jgi:hypothetical protein
MQACACCAAAAGLHKASSLHTAAAAAAAGRPAAHSRWPAAGRRARRRSRQWAAPRRSHCSAAPAAWKHRAPRCLPPPTAAAAPAPLAAPWRRRSCAQAGSGQGEGGWRPRAQGCAHGRGRCRTAQEAGAAAAQLQRCRGPAASPAACAPLLGALQRPVRRRQPGLLQLLPTLCVEELLGAHLQGGQARAGGSVGRRDQSWELGTEAGPLPMSSRDQRQQQQRRRRRQGSAAAATHHLLHNKLPDDGALRQRLLAPPGHDLLQALAPLGLRGRGQASAARSRGAGRAGALAARAGLPGRSWPAAPALDAFSTPSDQRHEQAAVLVEGAAPGARRRG